MYGNIEELLKERLISALKYNKLEDYLFGINIGYLPKNPRNVESGHCFYESQKVYNDLNKEYPSLNLDKKYSQTVINYLNNGNFFNVNSVFESIKSQLQLEKDNKNSFNLDVDSLKQFHILINNVLKENKKYLDSYHDRNSDTSKGIYDYIQESKDEVFGIKIL